MRGRLRQLRHLRIAAGQSRSTRKRRVGRARPEEETKPAAARTTAKPAKKKRKFPYRKVEDLEKDIAAGEAKVAELEASLASAETYRDANKFQETLQAFEKIKAELAVYTSTGKKQTN